MNLKQLLTKSIVLLFTALTLLISVPQTASADVLFCADQDTPVNVFMPSDQETGVIFWYEGYEGYDWANNYYDQGAGGEWQSAGGPYMLPRQGCYVLEVVTKDTPPAPGPWFCEYAQIEGDGAYQIAFSDIPDGPPTAIVDIGGTDSPFIDEIPEQFYCPGGYRVGFQY